MFVQHHFQEWVHYPILLPFPYFVTAQAGVEENDILSEIQSEII